MYSMLILHHVLTPHAFGSIPSGVAYIESLPTFERLLCQGPPTSPYFQRIFRKRSNYQFSFNLAPSQYILSYQEPAQLICFSLGNSYHFDNQVSYF